MTHFKKRGILSGLILILVGIIFLAKNFVDISFLTNIDWSYIWPIILIVMGLRIVIRKW